MTISLTENGLQVSTRLQLRDDLAAKLRARFGVNLRTEPISIMGQIIDVLTELRAADHQVFLSIWRSFDPNGAIARALDRVLAITGSKRRGPTNSVVDGELEFSAVGTVEIGHLIRNEGNGTVWALVTVDGLPDPYTSSGAETVDAQYAAVETGPILANAGTTWSVITVVPNLVGFENASDDADPGRDQETDADARIRRLRELHAQGQGPLAAIQGAVLRALGDDIVFCIVEHNPSVNPVDSRGIPFKAINVIAEFNPPTPSAEIQARMFAAIWSALGGGGEAFGTDYSGTTIDSEGNEQPIAFDTVDIVNVVMEIDLVTSTSEDPITPNIEAVVAAAVIEHAQTFHELVGRDVRRMDYSGVVKAMQDAGEISGVDDVVVRLSFDPDPPAAVAKLSVGVRERPDFDSGNLSISQV